MGDLVAPMVDVMAHVGNFMAHRGTLMAHIGDVAVQSTICGVEGALSCLWWLYYSSKIVDPRCSTSGTLKLIHT